ncbi:hypothetical protein ACJJTC_008120 [Scirpophaga incertulas]
MNSIDFVCQSDLLIAEMKLQLTVLLVVAALSAASAAKLPHSLAIQDSWDGLGLTADVNDYVDNTIHMLVPFIQEYGLDPMELPDVEEGFAVKPVLVTYSAWLKIHDGYMTGLASVSRSGDQTVNYFAKMLRVRLRLQFRSLEFMYKYLVKVMNIGPTGGIIGSLDRFVVVFDLLLDFNNDELHLQEFSLTDIGRLRVRLTGNILSDWLVNPMIGVFVRIFDNIIMRVVQTNIRIAIQFALDFINLNIKDILEMIESIGYQKIAYVH